MDLEPHFGGAFLCPVGLFSFRISKKSIEHFMHANFIFFGQLLNISDFFDQNLFQNGIAATD
ncbi:MAG: hypothetical protein AAF348_19410 [Bacteroidota bacterium]